MDTPIAYPSGSVLRAAITAAGATTLDFFRSIGGSVPILLLEKRLRGIVPQLWPSAEAAIANGLVALAALPQPLYSNICWGDGPAGWRATPMLFNEFPLPYTPLVALTSMGIPDGPMDRPYFSFVCSTLCSTWTIEHTLAGNPSVTIFNEANEVILGRATYWPGLVVITFSQPVEGFAYLV